MITTPVPTFAEVSWCDADIENALDVHGFPITEDNINAVLCHIVEEELVEKMIEAGWNYIYDRLWDAVDAKEIKED